MKDRDIHLRLTTSFLTIFCIALAVQALCCVVLFVHLANLLLIEGISAVSGGFLLLFMVSTLCDAATFLLFTILTAKVRHEGRPFGKWQTRILVAAGLLMSVKAVISIIWPTIQLPYSNVLGTAEPCFPSLIFNRFLTDSFSLRWRGSLNTVGYCRKMQTRFSRGWHGADCYAS